MNLLTRKKALKLLGLTILVYSTPIITKLDRTALAGSSRSCGGPNKGTFVPPGHQGPCPK